ncbi:hypothetical protein LCGC14_2879850 [marine sediment metagenome]|uniref:Uncharacterized protein n=1 Tax=marine sediment metagenome TaxID=412755 RepID=A0A0F8Y0M1_9ZZZZ
MILLEEGFFAAARFNTSRTVVVDQVIAIEYPIGIAAPAPAFEEC